jgi:D-alanyl-D-alanine carboxypeptidase
MIFAGATTTAVRHITKPSTGDTNVAAPVTSKAASETDAVESSAAPITFDDINLTAEAAFVYDITTDTVLFEQNADAALPIASITKLMTALVAHELIAEHDTVSINSAALRQYGNSGLMENERFTRESLTDLVLMSSSNDGAYALAAAAGSLLSSNNSVSAFVHAMNIRAEELGLHDTTFRNTTGLDISTTESGAESSARDIATLMTYLVTNTPELLAQTAEDRTAVVSEDGFTHDSQNTNYYLDKIPGVIGSKTGYTTLAGGNLTIAFNAGLDRPVVVVALGSGRRERFIDVVNLAAAAQTAIAASTQ